MLGGEAMGEGDQAAAETATLAALAQAFSGLGAPSEGLGLPCEEGEDPEMMLMNELGEQVGVGATCVPREL